MKLKSLFVAFGLNLSCPGAYAEADTFQGAYEVPAPEALKSFATLSLENIQIDLPSDPGGVRIEYQLPPELSGEGNHPIVLEGQAALDGKEFIAIDRKMSAFASCHLAPADFVECRVFYEVFDFSRQQVYDFLEGNFPIGPELEKRKRVADRFGGDAIGILRVFLKSRNLSEKGGEE